MTTYKAPTGDQVEAAMRRITKAQLRRAFFEGIQNPLWVKPLAEAGAFSSPPEPVVGDDGYVREPYWPEVEYLSRMATLLPDEVVNVLMTFRDSSNSWVRRAVFEIGAKIPAECGAQLRPLIESWKSSGFGWRTDPTNLVEFATNLLAGDQREMGEWFADLLFRPSATAEHGKDSVGLEDYWYERSLPTVAAALGGEGLKIVLRWLVAYERKCGHLTETSDISYFSREAIRQAEDSIHEVEQALIDAVRDLAIDAMLTDVTAATATLIGSKMLLARKIALFSLSEALERVSSDDALLRELLSAANELLLDEDSAEDPCRIDYAELARAVARATGEPVPALAQLLEAGPRIDSGRLREWVSGEAMDDAEVDGRVRDYIDRWKHRWLSAVGTGALPARLQSELAAFDLRYGVIDEPLVPSRRVHGWTGPNSPISQDEMVTMSPVELVAHLGNWQYSGDGWGPEPSHEGQGRELTALLTTNPKALAGAEDLVDRLRPTYVRAILRGWEAAVKAGLELEWTQAFAVIRDVLTHGDDSEFEVEGRRTWDDDLNYRPAKDAAVGLLEELAPKRGSTLVPAEVMSQVAEMLVEFAADEVAWREYAAEADDSGMDALTTSLNWQWPNRLRGLIHLMSHGTDTGWYNDARSALEVELERNDLPGSAWAVIGEGFGRLVDIDPEWVESRVPVWFGSGGDLSKAQQIALTTAMAIHFYHPKLYSLLSVSMISAIESPLPITPGWDTRSDPLQRIGEWVIDAIIRGHHTIDDAVAQTFFAVAPAKVRGEAIGHIAWSFMHAEVVDDEIRDRFGELWDERAAHVRGHPEDNEELGGFYWFVRSGKFPVEWWLPRLKEAAELVPSLSTERYMIGKEIAVSADFDPRDAFDVMKLLLEGRSEAGMASWDLTRNAVPMVLARAITSGDDQLRQDATAYMNHLGERGYLSLDADVRKVIDGSITQTDVEG